MTSEFSHFAATQIGACYKLYPVPFCVQTPPLSPYDSQIMMMPFVAIYNNAGLTVGVP